MRTKKNPDEIIKVLKKQLKEAQKTIAFLLTENSTTKTKLAEQEHFIQTANTIFSRLPGSIYWKGKNGVYLGCSDDMCNFLGMSRDQIIGHTDDYIGKFLGWPKEISAKAMKDDHDVIFNNSPRLNTEEIPFSDKNGKIIHLITSKVPLIDNNGEVIGVLGFSVDISERKHMEEALKRAKEAAEAADVAKTEFIANMSHDIRTPLSGIVGLGNIVEQEIQDINQKSKIHDIVKSANELLNMLNEILDVVRLGNVSVDEIHEEPFDIFYLVQTILDLEQSSVDLKNIHLISKIDESIPKVLIGDHKKIHHIILNLVGNSIKFTNKGQVNVKISLKEKQNNEVVLLFEISDTGIGIPSDSISRVFELFYKLTPSYKGLDKGHGIGLHIVKTYTELLGGQISVQSKLNEGSTFSFSLKLKIADPNTLPKNINHNSLKERSEEPPLLTPSITSSPQKLIGVPEMLIVEDNPLALTIAETLISQLQCNSTSAHDGESGLELAKNQRFDLILSDVGLPGISGIEFAKQLRAYEKEQHKEPTPIVALTGHAEGKIHEECIAAGINEVIIKPIRPEILAAICNKFALFGEKIDAPLPVQDSPLLTKISGKSALGADLPDTEDKLFSLQQFKIFDLKKAQKILGDNSDNLLKMLKMNMDTIIPQELPRLQQAHAEGDWGTVAHIVHKLKSGLVYVGLTRLAMACQYLERYHKTGNTKLLEKLYAQVLQTIDATTLDLKSLELK